VYLCAAVGYLARGIAARQVGGGSALTVISCDNLSHNGDKLRAAVVAFAKAAGVALDFGQLRFPNTMVDRITPAPTADLAEEVFARTGQRDAAPVVTEVFSEWVIADDFAGPRPDWPDTQIVADVAPYEMRKLRMLNGAHSLLAYLGQLRGYAYVHEAIADADIRAEVMALMADAMVTLDFERPALEAYRDALIARFENPSLAHALRQIAMDGSQKVPIRLLDVMRDLHRAGASYVTHAKAVACWCRYVQITSDLDDPLGHALGACADVSAMVRLIAPDFPDALVQAVVGAEKDLTL